MNSFVYGFLAPGRAFKLLLKNKKLFKYFIIPIVINAVVFLGFAIGVGWGMIDWINGLVDQQAAWYWAALFYFAIIFIILAVLLIIVFAFTAICNIIAAPFNDLLSEKTEEILNRKFDEEFSLKKVMADAWRAIKEEIKKFLLFDVSQLFLLILNLIPLIGTIIYAILSVLLSWWLLAYEYMEIPMGRRQLKFKDKRKFVNKNKATSIGFGAAVTLGTLIPVFNIFYIPTCVVAGTMLYHNLKK